MHSSVRFHSLRLGLSLLALTTPLAASADEAHSWCVPGAAKNRNGSSNGQVNDIVQHVCNASGFGYCCGDQAPGTWDLACIQKGSSYAFNQLNQDVCGRYAWAQGPVTGTQQYYPRDFNLVALGGAASGLADVEGPVASAGLATARSFSLNCAQKEQVALVAQGGVSFNNGTVCGKVQYAGSYNTNGRGVTYIHANPPNAATYPFPINFPTVRSKLRNMSSALSQYPTTPGSSATKSYSTLKFTGTNHVLNVFSISSTLLGGTTNYVFDVPPESTVIVNVPNATSVTIQNAGFSDASGRALPGNSMLWNFPFAPALTIQSVGFPGSILAPSAVLTLKWAFVRGTVVGWSATVDAELHWQQPFQMPGCGGCRCLDADWSCSADTILSDDGTRGRLGPEAGFLYIEGGPYTAEGAPRQAPDHRIWYSFRPADFMPKTRPIAVFFNGGPGAATSSGLFSFDTGPVKQIDPTGNATSLTLVSNAHSWTQFANLLYIDAPGAGFSYPLPHAGNTANDVGIDIDDDAGIFLRVILQFLRRHPGLRANRIILVGESYGGTRATLMLHYLYNYQQVADNGPGPYHNTRLYGDLMDYFSKVFATQSPGPLVIREAFGHQVLIDPGLVGLYQIDHNNSHGPQNCLPPSTDPDPNNPGKCWWHWTTTGGVKMLPTCDPYNCNKAMIDNDYWELVMMDLAAANLTKVAMLNQMLGVDASTIEWMKASARSQAFGREYGSIASPGNDWLDAFGHTLAQGDNYFLTGNQRVLDGYCTYDPNAGGCTGPPSRQWDSDADTSADVGGDFVLNAYRLRGTLITVAKYDAAVPSQSIPDALNDGIPHVLPCPQPGGAPCGASYLPNWSTSCSRPGIMRIFLAPIDGFTGQIVDVWMPTAYDAGHSVTMQDGDSLEAEVRAWFFDTSSSAYPW